MDEKDRGKVEREENKIIVKTNIMERRRKEK